MTNIEQRVSTSFSFFDHDDRFREIVAARQPKRRPRILYHYTDAAALKGIVEGRQLWATHFEYTNDASEVELGIRLAIEYIDHEIEQHLKADASVTIDEYLANPADGSDPSVALLQVVQKTLDVWRARDPKFYDFFFVCFSKRDDQLSQWRAYAADARGYSIGFACSGLERVRPVGGQSEATIDLLRVVYGKDDQLALIRRTISATRRLLDEVMPSLPLHMRKKCLVDFNMYLVACLIRLAVHFKYHGFEEEDEWRLIVSAKMMADLNESDVTVKTRACARGNVPYVELDLAEAPIRRIVIGPKAHAGESEDTLDFGVKELFRSRGLPVPQVERSNIPYR